MEDVVVTLALLLLAGIFLVSGIAKVFDPPGVPRSLVAFGVPTGAAHRFGWLLPCSEILIGIGLVVPLAAQAAAATAGMLLVLFLIGMAYNLANGRRPECHCFGRLYSAPISAATLLRNGLLAAVAFSLVWWGWQSESPLGSWAWLRQVGWSEWLSIGSTLAAGGFGALLFALWRQQGRLLNDLEELRARDANGPYVSDLEGRGPGLGSALPDITVLDSEGSKVALRRVLATGHDSLLLFVSPGCGPCRALLPDVEAWGRSLTDVLRPIVISSGGVEELRASMPGRDVRLFIDPGGAFHDLGVHGTPAALVVRSDGRVASTIVSGVRAVRALVNGIEARGPYSHPPPEAVVFDHVGRGRAK